MCNLKCEHCCKGESENVAMSDEVMDALLDNVYFIDEISVSGGEPIMYTERIRTLLDKCKDRNIKVNYFNVITNCTIRSDEFVSVFNDWIDYCTFGNENIVTISTDKFHKEYINNHLKNVDIESNIQWYRERLKPCNIMINNNNKYLDYNLEIFDEGRVNNWTESQKKEYTVVKKINTRKNNGMKLGFKEKCCGDENICKYGCVYNCIRDHLYLNVYGQLFPDTFTSFESQMLYKDICICNILDESIYDAVKKWNDELKKITENEDSQLVIRDRTFDILPLKIKNEIIYAELQSKAGNFDGAAVSLDKVGVYVSFIIKERNKYVDVWNDIYEYDRELHKDILTTVKAEKPDKYESLMVLFTSDTMLNNAVRTIRDMKNILDIRKEKNQPGTLEHNPDMDRQSCLLDMVNMIL